MSAGTDIDIVRQVLRGNTGAYALLVERYQDYVFTLAFRMLNNREDAEELAQDCFVKAFRNLGDFRNNSKFSTWLYTIVHRSCIDHLRKKKMITHPLDNGSDRIEQLHYEPAPEGLERKHALQSLHKAIATLKAEDAAIITLYYLHQQKLEEIAYISGIDLNAAKVRLYRARQRLRTVIETTYADDLL